MSLTPSTPVDNLGGLATSLSISSLSLPAGGGCWIGLTFSGAAMTGVSDTLNGAYTLLFSVNTSGRWINAYGVNNLNAGSATPVVTATCGTANNLIAFTLLNVPLGALDVYNGVDNNFLGSPSASNPINSGSVTTTAIDCVLSLLANLSVGNGTGALTKGSGYTQLTTNVDTTGSIPWLLQYINQTAAGVINPPATVNGQSDVAGITIAVYPIAPPVPASQGYIRQPGPGIGPDSRYQFSSIVRDASLPVISSSASILEGYDSLIATAGEITASASLLEGLDGIVVSVSTITTVTATIVEGTDIPAITGALITGAIAGIVEGQDVIAAAAGSTITAAAAIREGADILSFSASTGLTVSASIVEGHDGVGAGAVSTIVASAAVVEGADSLVALSPSITAASAAMVEGRDTVSITAQAAWVGSVAVVEGTDSLSAFASASTAYASLVEGLDSIVASASTTIQASASVLEGADILLSVGGLSVSASASIIEGHDYLASAVLASIVGFVNVTEGLDSVAITATTSPTQFSYADIIALSQTGIQGVRSAYLENSACFIVAAYFNAARTPIVPAAVQYRVDDVVSGANLVPWTPIVPDTVNEVTISSLQNGIVSYSRASETHQVLFQITDSVGDVNYARVLFDVIRVPGLPMPDIVFCGANIVEGNDVVVGVS